MASLRRTPLVGRGAELAALKAEYRDVAGGLGGRLVLIGGEPGVGKTRLAEELGRYSEERGGRFLVGRYLREGSLPYQAWTEALEPALRPLGTEDLTVLAGRYAADLAPVLPELSERLAPPPSSVRLTPQDGWRRLFEG